MVGGGRAEPTSKQNDYVYFLKCPGIIYLCNLCKSTNNVVNCCPVCQVLLGQMNCLGQRAIGIRAEQRLSSCKDMPDQLSQRRQ